METFEDNNNNNNIKRGERIHYFRPYIPIGPYTYLGCMF